MKKINFIIPAILSLAIISCTKKNPFPGYEDVGNGSYLLMLKKSGDSTSAPQEGGLIFVHMKLKNKKDSVFMDLNDNPQYPGQAFPIPVRKVKFTGDIMDMFTKFHKGDSGTFFISLDSLKKYYKDTVMNQQTGQPEIKNEFDFHNTAYDTMKYVGFILKIDSIYDKAKFDKLKEEENQRMIVQQAVQDTLGPMQQRAQELEPMLKKNDSKLLKEYLTKNHVTVKPDKEGIYFIETDPGSGAMLSMGTPVGVRYTGKYLDGTIFDSNALVPGQELLTFRLGIDPMIPGFVSSVLKMKKGGKATFILPPAMGYKDSLTRVFDVEVVNPAN
ncbi:MAG TPA: FKBP-type peptidyl-prolyl cis-trans isomerase [Bacteroidia bacterium]|jgi:FKBP-type peptidyl-prolyl cis-trans isomerase|nr:FKBP-type peptidyl-prolyl cis-trans isomerase [Bacteroidia bacterium]